MSKQTQLGIFGNKEIKPKNPPAPLKKKTAVNDTLLYAKMGTLAVDGVQCEKYGEHGFDGTLATCLVMYRYSNWRNQANCPLCEKHAKELIDHLASPSCNTGLTDTNSCKES